MFILINVNKKSYTTINRTKEQTGKHLVQGLYLLCSPSNAKLVKYTDLLNAYIIVINKAVSIHPVPYSRKV